MGDGEGCTYERVTVTNCGHLPAPEITVDYDKMCRYDRICREVRHRICRYDIICREVRHNLSYATDYAGIICRMRQIMPVRQIMPPQSPVSKLAARVRPRLSVLT